MTSGAPQDDADVLAPYVPRLLGRWEPSRHDERHMRIDGTVAFVDISGFTRLTERLARKGNVGAEEMSDILDATFAGLLDEAREDGADLIKWGGDAVLLLFEGRDHAPRAARAAHRMRARLRVIGHLPTTSGTVVLRMSVGIHSGDFDFFLVGDAAIHRELLISGPGASTTAVTEAAADAGQIGLSAATASLLDPRHLGASLLDGRLLRSAPPRIATADHHVPARPVDPRQVLPPPIREHLLSRSVEPEHRLITVSFVQFSGTDDLMAAAGPAALAEALDDVVRNVQHACADHGVTFFETDINRDGGKIMLTAGAPRSADHDEERMLRVARQVLDRSGRLPLRIGVNRGHVFAGDFGPAFRRTFSVKGDAINLAARVMGKARPGTVLATTQVVAQSHAVFRTTDVAPFMVKGKSQPVVAEEVGELLGARREDGLAPLVGREEEKRAVDRCLADLRDERGAVLEIVGEAGIGKSRLLAEALAGTEVEVAHVLCEQNTSASAYSAVRHLLREVMGLAPDASPVEVARMLLDRVAGDAPSLVPWVPLVGVAMDVDVPMTREVEELDELYRKTRLEEVVTELLGAMLHRPTILLVEDAHAMDDSSADLLHRLAVEVAHRPWLLAVTRRDEDSGYVPRAGMHVTTMRPGPLGHEASVQLVRDALDLPLPDLAVDELARRGGGNPMFLHALARAAGRTTSMEELPGSVEALVTSQIDRLDPADRSALRYASVLGTMVDESALDSLLEEHDVRVPPGAMDRLRDFLVRDERGALRFRSGLMRDVAYEGLPFRQRRILHDHVSRAIERVATSPESHCESLSLHCFHAGRHEAARRYSQLAGERAMAKYAPGEAAEFFDRAARSCTSTSTEPAVVAQVYEKLADCRWLIGLTQEASDAYAVARRHLRGDPVATAGIIEKQTRIDQRRRKHPLAMRRISGGLRELEGVTGPPADAARSKLARRYADSRFRQGRVDQALEWAERAARYAEDSLDKETLAAAYEVLNHIYAGSGRDEPLPYGRLALQAYTELGDLRHQGWCLNNLAAQDVTAGRWAQSLADFRRAADLFRRTGDTAAEVNTVYNQAEILVRQRRYDEALDLLPVVLRTARAVEDEELVALAEREQARALAGTGALDRGLAVLALARARFADLHELEEVAGTDLVLAEVLQDAGRHDDARDVLDQVDDARRDAATYHRLVGRDHADAGRVGAARSAWATAVELADRDGDRLEHALSLEAIASLAGPADLVEDSPVRRAQEALDSLGVLPAR
ncbi:AAA family ATPase [Nocardioides KLBMP 9356]|uniref:AAA family ATPase n=1 Tax=Nocardioides potassii TaxID=2911371 RepID=A0ABS9HDG9_9ACTN|nr:adenylate/guanylate cyclase domain-containing protein [Nocardioides potassii]MCF6378259.1 AAA family ATPase [Nocardioides potassii]